MASGERLQVVTAKDLLPRPMTRRTLLVGGLAAAVSLAGCGGGEPQPGPRADGWARGGRVVGAATPARAVGPRPSACPAAGGSGSCSRPPSTR
jgi:hypothetical protein